MNKGSIVERLCSDLDRKEPRYKSPTLLYFYDLPGIVSCLLHMFAISSMEAVLLTVVRPAVCNSLPHNLRDPAVRTFMQNFKNIFMTFWSISALETIMLSHSINLPLLTILTN